MHSYVSCISDVQTYRLCTRYGVRCVAPGERGHWIHRVPRRLTPDLWDLEARSSFLHERCHQGRSAKRSGGAPEACLCMESHGRGASYPYSWRRGLHIAGRTINQSDDSPKRVLCLSRGPLPVLVVRQSSIWVLLHQLQNNHRHPGVVELEMHEYAKPH